MNSTARYDFNLVKIFMVDFQATKAQNTKNLHPNKWNVWYVCQQKFSQQCSGKESIGILSGCVTWMANGSLDTANVNQNSDTRDISFASGWFIVVVGGGGGVCPGSYSCSRFVLCFCSCYHCLCVCFVLLLFVICIVIVCVLACSSFHVWDTLLMMGVACCSSCFSSTPMCHHVPSINSCRLHCQYRHIESI